MLPKWTLDPNKHEVGRSCRYLSDNTLDYIAFRLPNRTGVFQEDLYPAFEANEPSNDLSSWLSGADKPVKTMQIRPGQEVQHASSKTQFSAKPSQSQPVHSESSSNAADLAKHAEELAAKEKLIQQL